MHTIRRLVLGGGALLSLAMLASPVAAATTGEIHVQKTCPTFTGQVGGICTVTVSDAGPIPVGTVATYYGPTFSPYLDSVVLLTTPAGDVASGRCVLDFETNRGACLFQSGSGALAGIQAVIAITDHPDTGITDWDGTYWLG